MTAGTRGLQKGDVAPDFMLPGSDGETHRLSDLVGRRAVIIAWFPKAFTGG
jgi:peroxiredoxin Q/BCP